MVFSQFLLQIEIIIEMIKTSARVFDIKNRLNTGERRFILKFLYHFTINAINYPGHYYSMLIILFLRFHDDHKLYNDIIRGL